jgi:hypothetical protein
MDRHSPEQYLASLPEEYRRANRKQKKKLLNEALRRTGLNRKVLIRNLAHPAAARARRPAPEARSMEPI